MVNLSLEVEFSRLAVILLAALLGEPFAYESVLLFSILACENILKLYVIVKQKKLKLSNGSVIGRFMVRLRSP